MSNNEESTQKFCKALGVSIGDSKPGCEECPACKYDLTRTQTEYEFERLFNVLQFLQARLLPVLTPSCAKIESADENKTDEAPKACCPVVRNELATVYSLRLIHARLDEFLERLEV